MNGPPLEAPPLTALAERLESAHASDDVDELLRIAALMAEQGARWTAMEIVQDALGLAPTRPGVHAAIARVYRLAGSRAAAAIHERLLVRYSRLVDRTDELDALAERASLDGDVSGLVDVSARHARQRRLQPALEACYEALRIAPGDPDVHLQLARVRVAMGWRRLAMADLERLSRLLELTGDEPARRRLATFVEGELGGSRPETGLGPGPA
jgi:tetratricopeptide (TPR) repeat protein